MSLKEQIQQTDDIVRVPVPTPEWPDADGKLFAQSLRGRDRDDWEASNLQRNGRGTAQQNYENIRARLVVRGTVDAEGNRVFEPSDAEWLGGKNAAVLDRLFTRISQLSGLTDEDVEELTKN